jgi:non-ribosomal peptide synthetase component F
VREVLLRQGVILAVVIRPWLWRSALALAPPGWWRRRPFLPLPDPDYAAFRLQTMYGDAGHAPEPADVVTYLDWCRRYRRLVR